MSSANKVFLLGRLTRDPEVRSFSNGGKVAQFGFAVDGSRKKDQSTGKWVSEPCFLDVKAWNRGEKGTTADICEKYLSKGKQCFIEGKLVMESWEKDGQKRSKIVVEVIELGLLDGGNGRGSSDHSEESNTQSSSMVGENPFG